MNINKQNYVKKIKVKYDNCDKCVYAMVNWKENDSDLFEIHIFDQENIWTGSFSREAALIFSKEILEDVDKYCASVKEALTKESRLYSYTLSSLEVPAQFAWKKQAEKSKVIFLHGKVPLHKAKDKNKDSLIDYLLNENNQLKENVEHLNTKIQNITYELDKSKNDLQQFLDNKIAMEKNLYGKFAKLLNAKKRRITLLQETLSSITEADQ
ncbi:hypothetical protein JYU34_018889 [Plutella xylostella]|uniref:Uncharacterized protein n=1 Tax=Plutella xylostella TaxID=51655 RepID=A0ABQ7PYQ7_PLUXY|nr:hypothetical protein JYU34_018889 [Plutella xylostella]